MQQEVLHTVIYVDVLIFTNILINYFILSAVKKFLHIKVKTIRIIFASLFGAVCSLAVFLPLFNTPVSMVIRLFVAVGMVFIGFEFKDFRAFLRNVTCTFVFSVIFCGIMILFYEIIKPSHMAIINDIVYFDISPVLLICVTLVIYLVVIIISRTVYKDDVNTTVDLKIRINNNEYECIGKIDTGNTVTEPFSGAPVIITEQSVIGDKGFSATRLVPYKTLGNEGLMNAVKADNVEINKRVIDKEVYIGIYVGEIDKEIKAIINSKVVR